MVNNITEALKELVDAQFNNFLRWFPASGLSNNR